MGFHSTAIFAGNGFAPLENRFKCLRWRGPRANSIRRVGSCSPALPCWNHSPDSLRAVIAKLLGQRGDFRIVRDNHSTVAGSDLFVRIDPQDGGVMDRRGTIAVRNLRHQRAVQNVSRNGCVRRFAGRRKLQVNFVEILFGIIEKNQETRMVGSEGLQKSAANRTSSSNDEGCAGVRCAEQRRFRLRVQFATDCRCAQSRTQKARLNAADWRWPGRRDHPRQPRA